MWAATPVDHPAGRKLARPADEARHVDSALVHCPLQAAQSGVEADLGGTVVRQEDDDRVSVQPSSLKAARTRPTFVSMFVTMA